MSITKKHLSPRLSPDAPGGIKKLQVGCNPKNILPDWWNVDIRWFPGIDQVMTDTRANYTIISCNSLNFSTKNNKILVLGSIS
jgi:hypothetical protein